MRRIVEFLNEQMDPAEVLAIEVKQFVGKGVKTLVPRVLGQTETARQKKAYAPTPRNQISNSEFLSQIAEERSEDEVRIIRILIDWARNQGLEETFLQGARGSDFVPILTHEGRSFSLLNIQKTGSIVIPMRRLKDYPPFNDSAKRSELFGLIQMIPDLKVTDTGGMEGFPKFPIKSLSNDDTLRRFIDALNWMVSAIRATTL